MSAIWDHRTITLDDLRVHYLESGSGRPLVLLHGGLATAEMSWNTPLSLLAGDFRLVAPDTRAGPPVSW
jgi:pimeloyl-ACP methyl ester carboxylesterase